MKVLVLSHTSDLIGGAERSMLDVFDYWAAKYGLQPEFILREPLGSMVAEMKRRGWKYYPIKYTFWAWTGKPTKPEDILQYASENAAAVKRVEKIILKTKPDVVITNSIISPWGALAAYFQDVPHVWLVREYGDLDHSKEFDMSHEQTYEDVGNLSNLVVGNSATISKHIVKFMPKSKVATLYNPFDLKKLQQRANDLVSSPFMSKDSLKLVMTSNITTTKGQLEAVKVTGLLNQSGHDVELCIAGKNVDKKYFAKIEDTIAKYKIANKVHLVGLQPNALAFVALSDVGIVASRKEAFGRTTFEYLAIGKPVVGANSGATPEMVKPGVTGYLYRPGDVQDLAKALEHYINHPELLTKHGAASRSLAKTMMGGPDNIDALYKKVKDVADGQGQPKGQPIHFIKQWSGYNDETKQLLRQARSTSLKRKARWHARQLAKTNYYRAKKLKARLTGK